MFGKNKEIKELWGFLKDLKAEVEVQGADIKLLAHDTEARRDRLSKLLELLRVRLILRRTDVGGWGYDALPHFLGRSIIDRVADLEARLDGSVSGTFEGDGVRVTIKSGKITGREEV